jgi:hypothetical protein
VIASSGVERTDWRDPGEGKSPNIHPSRAKDVGEKAQRDSAMY